MTNPQRVRLMGILTICFCWVFPVSAGTLVDLRLGSEMKMQDVLSQDFTLIYLEKACSSCQRYLKSLKNCPDSLRSRIRYVSTDTAAQAKQFARSMPAGTTVYLMKNRKDFSGIYATPTTQTRWGQKVGALSCDQVQELQSEIKVSDLKKVMQ